MSRLRRTFVPWVFWSIIALACACGVAVGLWAVTTVHAARKAEERVCAAELREVKARNPVVRAYLAPADPCLALRVVSGRAR